MKKANNPKTRGFRLQTETVRALAHTEVLSGVVGGSLASAITGIICMKCLRNDG
jgi:hypothetical protein